MRARRQNRTFVVLALGMTVLAISSLTHVPRGIGPGSGRLATPHPGVGVKNFDSRWIPVAPRDGDILKTLRDLRLETSTMWFRVDCSEQIYNRDEIELIHEGGVVWVAAGQPKPTAPPAQCRE